MQARGAKGRISLGAWVQMSKRVLPERGCAAVKGTRRWHDAGWIGGCTSGDARTGVCFLAWMGCRCDGQSPLAAVAGLEAVQDDVMGPAGADMASRRCMRQQPRGTWAGYQNVHGASGLAGWLAQRWSVMRRRLESQSHRAALPATELHYRQRRSAVRGGQRSAVRAVSLRVSGIKAGAEKRARGTRVRLLSKRSPHTCRWRRPRQRTLSRRSARSGECVEPGWYLGGKSVRVCAMMVKLM